MSSNELANQLLIKVKGNDDVENDINILKKLDVQKLSKDLSTENHQKAFFYFLDGSKRKDPWAMFFLALCSEQGIGTKKDTQAANLWYKQAQQLQNQLAGVFQRTIVSESDILTSNSLI